jgi:hypothetical protein
MQDTESATQQQENPCLREHVKIVRLGAEFMERALKNAPSVSLDVWGNWRGFRRSVEDLIALIRFAR